MKLFVENSDQSVQTYDEEMKTWTNHLLKIEKLFFKQTSILFSDIKLNSRDC